MNRALRDAEPHNPVGRDPVLRETLHRRLLDAPFDPAMLERPELRARLARILREEAPLLAPATADVVLDQLVYDVGGLGPLEPLLDDPSITEIMVNGADRVFIEREGRVVPVVCEIDAPTIVRLVERVVAPLGLRLDRASPMVDARLADGSRLHAVIPPLAPDGPCLSIRRFGAGPVPLAAFGVETEAGAFFDAMVRAGWNLVVSGATSSGKTTCCNALTIDSVHGIHWLRARFGMGRRADAHEHCGRPERKAERPGSVRVARLLEESRAAQIRLGRSAHRGGAPHLSGCSGSPSTRSEPTRPPFC